MTLGVVIDMWVVFKARSSHCRQRKSQKTEPGWR